jgi:hypothetical protein
MAFDQYSGGDDHNAADQTSSWRRVAFPVPPLGKFARASGFSSRMGAYSGSALAGWVATGHTRGDITWATVILAVAVITTDALRAHKCTCPVPLSKPR